MSIFVCNNWSIMNPRIASLGWFTILLCVSGIVLGLLTREPKIYNSNRSAESHVDSQSVVHVAPSTLQSSFKMRSLWMLNISRPLKTHSVPRSVSVRWVSRPHSDEAWSGRVGGRAPMNGPVRQTAADHCGPYRDVMGNLLETIIGGKFHFNKEFITTVSGPVTNASLSHLHEGTCCS